MKIIEEKKCRPEQIRPYDDTDGLEEFLNELEPLNLTRLGLAEKVAHWSWELCLKRAEQSNKANEREGNE